MDRAAVPPGERMPTLMDIAERNAHLSPAAAAVRCAGEQTSHAQLASRARRIAQALRGLGLRRQERFAVLSMNTPDLLAAYLAAAAGGFVLNTVNFRLAPAEIGWILADGGARVLLFEAQYAAMVDALRPQLPAVEHWFCLGPGEVPDWARDWEALLAAADDAGLPQPGTAADYVCLMYTSGTTGKPKGVVHDNRSMLCIAEVLSSELALVGQARLLAIAPLFHMGAATLALAAMFRGGCAVLLRGFDAAEVVRTIEAERITAVHMVPTMVQAVLDAPEFGRYDLSSLRMLMYAAAPMPLPLARRAAAAFGPILYNGYGQTEINLITLLTPERHLLDGSPEQVARLASVGQPHWQSQVRIVADDGHDCAVGEIGEVVARSQTAMAGYWNNTAATLATLRDGWIHTGDVGYLDAEGYLFLVDRKRDVIISGGENIYSREVEDAIAAHPAVRECAVVGVADERWGEAVKAFVVATGPLQAEELVAWCRQHIAGYKCPKQVAFVQALPRLATGKIDKGALRTAVAAPPPPQGG